MEKVLNNSYFTIGSKVMTDKGYVNIENLTLDMQILNSDNEFCNILEIQESEEMDVMQLTTIDDKIFEATKNQFFMVSQKKKGIYTIPQRKMISKLNKDDYLVSHYEQDGSGHIYYQYSAIKNIKKLEEKKKTYNLIVEGNHTYIINDKIVCDNSIMVNKK